MQSIFNSPHSLHSLVSCEWRCSGSLLGSEGPRTLPIWKKQVMGTIKKISEGVAFIARFGFLSPSNFLTSQNDFSQFSSANVANKRLPGPCATHLLMRMDLLFAISSPLCHGFFRLCGEDSAPSRFQWNPAAFGTIHEVFPLTHSFMFLRSLLRRLQLRVMTDEPKNEVVLVEFLLRASGFPHRLRAPAVSRVPRSTLLGAGACQPLVESGWVVHPRNRFALVCPSSPSSRSGSSLPTTESQWFVPPHYRVAVGRLFPQQSRSRSSLLTIGSQWVVPPHNRVAVVRPIRDERREAWLALASNIKSTDLRTKFTEAVKKLPKE